MFPRDGSSAMRLLSSSAALIRSWARVDAETLRFLGCRNSADLVLLLTKSGPQLVLKQQTQGAYRLNKMTYYDVSFAHLLLAKSLKNSGKIQGTFQDVMAEWVAQGCECVFLGTRRRQVREELVEEVLNLPEVVSLRAALISEATRHHEWFVIGHDATYQTLFSVIGQEKMDQKAGEAHALHTLVGRTGCVPGFSLQPTESGQCFQDAVCKILPLDARSTCHYVFSDSPSMAVGAKQVLPNLVGVAEDALHLVLRVEACTGEKRTAMSAHILRMQLKFKQPLAGPLFHGGDANVGGKGAWKEVQVERDWGEYGKLPYSIHQEYLDDLSTVTQLFPELMRRQDHKGRSVRQILEAGGSFVHFLFLKNGSHIIFDLQQKFGHREMELLSWGTCGNEALHFQLKHVQQSIVQQHVEQVPIKLAAFSLGKLLAHSAAAYHPTLAQRSAAEILAIVEGRARQGFLFQSPEVGLVNVVSIADMRKPVHDLNLDKCKRRASVRKKQEAQWAKEVVKRARRNAKRPAPKGSTRTMKRTVFSKKKILAVHEYKHKCANASFVYINLHRFHTVTTRLPGPRIQWRVVHAFARRQAAGRSSTSRA